MSEDRPLFRELGQCLRWEYYGVIDDADTVEPSAIAGFMGRDNRQQSDDTKSVRRGPPAVPTARRPKRYNASAQAGMLKAFLQRLPGIQRNHLKAKYLLGRQRSIARSRLVRPVHSRAGIDWLTLPLTTELVAEYYGKPLEDKDLLEKHDIGRNRLNLARRKVAITLDAVSAQAEQQAYDYYQKGRVLA